MDCVFLLDRSGSVGRTNHNIALNFINNVISFFTIGSSFSRIGMAGYSSSSAIQFDLDDHTTSQALVNGVSQVGYTGGSTNTPSALDHARLLLDPANNRGARPNSLGIPKIAISLQVGTYMQQRELSPPPHRLMTLWTLKRCHYTLFLPHSILLLHIRCRPTF